MTIQTYIDGSFGGVVTSDVSGSLKRKGGASCGLGGAETLILETLIFDESQITSPANGNVPRWNDNCHTLSGEAGRAVVIIREKDDGKGTAAPVR